MNESKPLGITDVVLRDGHQSLLATRMRIDDMLPIAEKLDQIGYWSLETWGGAVFDSCIRYLGEDPWERLRILKKAMPNTRQQMLFRAQNILGYRHYSDDVVQSFVERAAVNGIDVFRIFDAMNDLRNFETAVKATLATGRHAQGTMSYTVSPKHNLQYWLDMARGLEDMGCQSICIKDMAGLLKPYVAYELISELKKNITVPISMHCHATTGMSTATNLKASEAGIDMLDTSISSMSMTYGHTATESMVAILADTPRSTGLDLIKLEEVAAYFREVRKKYVKFEGALKGIDSRILVAQVPGGMLTNMENQLKEQGAADKMDEVLQEIPRVREDLGYIPLVTPTSQIVGSQAVLNVLTGERYRSITKETSGVLRGAYGETPGKVNAELQARVVGVGVGDAVITCRPADLISPEMEMLTEKLEELAQEKGFKLAENQEEDVLIYALFPQIGLKFLENRGNPDTFEPVPSADDLIKSSKPLSPESYVIEVQGIAYSVQVTPNGDVEAIVSQSGQTIDPMSTTNTPLQKSTGQVVPSPLAGNIFKVMVVQGQKVEVGDVLLIMEAMKMETEVRAPSSGVVSFVSVKEGDSVQVGDALVNL